MENEINITMSAESLQEEINSIQQVLDSKPESITLTIKGVYEK